jgi:ParB family chromosome partitioning protein
MSKIKSASKIKINSFDDLFGMDETVGSIGENYTVKEIPLVELHEFKNHPFHAKEDKVEEMAESIAKHGVLVPGICRMRSMGGYEIIAGHTRKAACEKAGLNTMPMVVKNLSDDDAVIVMVDSNIQREDVLISEKARAFKMRYEAMKHQGAKGNSLAAMSEDTGENAKKIQRYIWIARLNDELLDMVDAKKLPFAQATDISFLNTEEQQWVLDAINDLHIIPSMVQSAELKELSQKQTLEITVVRQLLEPKTEPVKKRKVTIKAEKLNDYFADDVSEEEITEIIMELLEDWKRRQE